jgi:hypothetical protein
LDCAIAHDIPHGGWCPKDRWAEDGAISRQYPLQETPDSDPAQRTEWNVRDSDGTVIFSMSEKLSGGSLRTLEFARRLGKPCLHLCQSKPHRDCAGELRAFVQHHKIKVLNIAGPRASAEPKVSAFVHEVLERLLGV